MQEEDTRFAALVEHARRLALTDPGDRRWRSVLPAASECAAFVRWANAHPRWRHNVADVADRVCAKPVEASVAILCEITAELLDDPS